MVAHLISWQREGSEWTECRRLKNSGRSFFEKPVRNDITFDEVEKLSVFYGCIVKKSGGKHPMKVIHVESGTVIPIPKHGKCVGEAYVAELKTLFTLIEKGRND